MTWSNENLEFVKSKGYKSIEEYILSNIDRWDYLTLIGFTFDNINIPDSILKQKLMEENKRKERSSEEQLSASMMS